MALSDTRRLREPQSGSGRKIASIALAAALAAGSVAVSAPSRGQAKGPPPGACASLWSITPGKPLVSRKETARDIFLALEADFFSGTDRSRDPDFVRADKNGFPEITVIDEGDHWHVGRSKPDAIGGGQLQMKIAKCDGAVSHVGRGQ